jgi:ubiquitin C-terminal hydrolase
MPEYIFMTLQHFGDNDTDFTIEKSTIQSGIEYELCGLIEHIGPSESSGHYVSYILDQSNKHWYIFDDDRVYRYKSIDEKCNQNNRLYSQILVVWYRIFRVEDDSDIEDTNTIPPEA